MLHALVVDDDMHSLSALAELVEAEGFDTATADNLAQARSKLEQRLPDVVLSDLMLPDGRGTELLKELLEEPTVEVILITGKATVETAVEALRLGAFDYLTKPIDLGRLKTLLARVKDTRELKQEVSSLRAELRDLGRFGPMVGTAPAMQRVYDLIDKVAPTEATAFLIGESGTGKELAAETVHRLSKRRKGPYLPLNCGAVSPTLIESELFGHEKGSFTGAQRQHRGYFERASGGTLFLDEITEMPIELQVKLLRVLETGRIMRVGGDREVDINVRVIAATNRNADDAVKDGKLREDLLYRLKVFPITLPPLRDREGDIRRWRSTSCTTSTSGRGPPSAFRSTPWSGCAPITGQATCASCRTWYSERSSSARTRSPPTACRSSWGARRRWRGRTCTSRWGRLSRTPSGG